MRRDESSGHDRADAEEGTVAEGCDNTAEHHDLVARCEGGEDIADDEEDHEADERRLAVELGHRHSQQYRSDRDGEGIAGDEIACDGLGDTEVSGYLGQQPHDDELRESDSEPADGECEQCEWHGVSPFAPRKRSASARVQ